MDPLTLILLIIAIIFFFPLIMRGIGCALRLAALAIVIIVLISLISSL
ncbi:hypothetical protein B0H94_104107 [Salsuginibacillus halophilus]|uniref:Uncharacterized protein n=1 Tax=Salsuginibacillus halophilus TaxID=517424 RepID=A0A2P8HQK8_9BACI|nr:hypothetical protein [Salsuginibacillus halophilus]PSL48507.1 hypothetical protein B0H94_104107 [Salsuginibacillus halophilus]